MLGNPSPSTATEGASPTSSTESGTIGTNRRPPGTSTAGSGRVLHAAVSATRHATAAMSRPRVAGTPSAMARGTEVGLDTTPRILASIVSLTGEARRSEERSRRGADAHRKHPEHFLEEPAGVGVGV